MAEVARSRGVRSVVEFLGPETGESIARQYGQADLVAGNNVFAHVPDIRGFAAGLRALVKDTGVVTLEFPHLLRLIERRQYDTIYHEHYPTFRCSRLRVHCSRLGCGWLTSTSSGRMEVRCGFTPAQRRVLESRARESKEVLDEEATAGLDTVAGHAGFASDVMQIKSDLVGFLLDAAKQGNSVAGYGAPGKGNTLLNHCGIREDLLAYTVDRSPFKQGRFLPGTHIPIFAPERLAETQPDYILVLPWNLKDEISRQLEYVRSWGGRLVFPIPTLEIV